VQPADLAIVHASELVTCRAPARGAIGTDLQHLEIITDGAVAVRDGRVVDVAPTADLLRRWAVVRVLDAHGRVVSPGLVDSHSHLVYAGSRHAEYESIVTGNEEASTRLGGGIRYTVGQTRRASSAELEAQAREDLGVMLAHGTTTLEAKSGYGLDRDTELRLLAILKGLRHTVDVVPTYLAAHVPPNASDRARGAYVQVVLDTLPAARAFADYCDVTCDPVAFTSSECRRIAEEATRLGYRLRVHADQTGYAGGAELAADLGAASADHLDYVSETGIAALAAAGTTGVLVPGVTFHMMETMAGVRNGAVTGPVKPFLAQKVHRMIERGVRLAIATDYNPGSSPTPSLQMAMQLAARIYRLSYAAVWHMSTINAAHALDRGDDRGSIEIGKRADLVIWDVPEHGMVINTFGVNLVDRVIKDGTVVVGRTEQ
jgi:imidazolonepropionase